jgi:hypothetical protein
MTNDIPPDWKERFNDPEYDPAFARLLGDIENDPYQGKRPGRPVWLLGCLLLVVITAVAVAAVIVIANGG